MMGRYTGRLLAVVGIAVLASTFASTAVAGAQVDTPSPPPFRVTLIVPGTVVVGGTVAVVPPAVRTRR